MKNLNEKIKYLVNCLNDIFRFFSREISRFNFNKLDLFQKRFKNVGRFAVALGILSFALLSNETALATYHFYNPSLTGTQTMNKTDLSSNYIGNVFQLATITEITQIWVSYCYNGMNPQTGTAKIGLWDMDGNLIEESGALSYNTGGGASTQCGGSSAAIESFVWTLSNPQILNTGLYYVGIKENSRSFGVPVSVIDGQNTYLTCKKTYSGTGVIGDCSDYSSLKTLYNGIYIGSAGGAQATWAFPLEGTSTPAFSVFKNDIYNPSTASKYFTLEIDTAIATTTNFSECSAYVASPLCYRISNVLENNQAIHDNYETLSPISWFQQNNLYYSKITLIENGVELASSTISYFINSSSTINNSVYENFSQPPFQGFTTFEQTTNWWNNNVSDSWNNYTSSTFAVCNWNGLISSSTLTDISCYAKSFLSDVFFNPYDPIAQGFYNSLDKIKNTFPFSLVLGPVSTIQKAIDSSSAAAPDSLALTYKTPYGNRTLFSFSSTTLESAAGSDLKNKYFAIVEAVLWISGGFIILSFI